MAAERSRGGANPLGAVFGKVLITGVWLVFTLLALAIATEGVLQILRAKKQQERSEVRAEMPTFRKNRAKCGGFSVKNINPHYLFFFPFDPDERKAKSTENCNVDADGFRGDGPAHAGEKKLAFVLGGSSVFGQGTSDSTTIAGVLNELQSEYHVVNAGVQSWNSTQELFRLAYQILEFEPDLVIALDGANDIQISIKYREKGYDYPPGTPEGFDDLSRLVGDIKADYIDISTEPWHERFFPRLSKNLRKLVAPRKGKDRSQLPDERIEGAADKYVMNHKLMNLLVTERGGRFLSVFQPVTCLHSNVDTTAVPCRDPVAYEKFHARVFEHEVAFDRLDFSNLFDEHFEVVPVFDPKGNRDITDEAIFFDAVHLWDGGDRLIALRLRDYLLPSD